MSTQLFSNNAIALLKNPITVTDTSLTVKDGLGYLYPSIVNPGDFFLITLENLSPPLYREIIKVTSRIGDVLHFNLADRGQEGTPISGWTEDATLVDHRITAETMRQAFLQPVSSGGSALLTVKDHGSTVGAGIDTSTLNFTGNVLITDNGATKTINIGGTSGGDIHGGSPGPIAINPGLTLSTNTVTYSQYSRGFKFFVTIFSPSTFDSCTFEVLGNINGNLAVNSENVVWNKSARVGYNFKGSVSIDLDNSIKELSLTWHNQELYPVEVICTRIQQIP